MSFRAGARGTAAGAVVEKSQNEMGGVSFVTARLFPQKFLPIFEKSLSYIAQNVNISCYNGSMKNIIKNLMKLFRRIASHAAARPRGRKKKMLSKILQIQFRKNSRSEAVQIPRGNAGIFSINKQSYFT